MQQFSDISFAFLSTQICTNCQMPVTCGPVYVVVDSGILCGRCRMTAKDHYRNYAYEALASNFIYPCKNWANHCPVRLRWNDSLDHEPECNYIGCCRFMCRHPGAFLKGKKDIPRDEIRLSLVPESFLEYLECVLCRGYLSSSPVFLQSNGQNVCHRCIYANGPPPNCRRNHAYENFSQIFLFPCTFRNRGCKERIQFGKEIWKHEAQCEYAPYNMSRNSPSHHQDPFRPSLKQNFDQRNHQRPSLRPNNDPRYANTRQDDFQRPSLRTNEPMYANDYRHESPTDQQRPSLKPKEKGLVKTHSGHIWATLTPNSVLFAPPDKEHVNMNKQLLKSLAKKQGRQIRRVDDIGNEMGRRSSDSESVSTNDSYTIKTSNSTTPEPHLDDSRRPYNMEPTEDYPRQQYSQYPVLMPHQLSDGFDSVRRTSHQRESARGNNLLINELKIKQDYIKRTHSIKEEPDRNSPYRQCNNLGDIMEVNRQIR